MEAGRWSDPSEARYPIVSDHLLDKWIRKEALDYWKYYFRLCGFPLWRDGWPELSYATMASLIRVYMLSVSRSLSPPWVFSCMQVCMLCFSLSLPLSIMTLCLLICGPNDELILPAVLQES